MGKTSKQFIKNSFWNFLSVIITKVGAIIFTIILARKLMPENYGLFSIVFSTAMIFMTFADWGINDALIKYISDSRKNKTAVSPYSYLFRIKLLLSLAVFVVFSLISYRLSIYVFKDMRLFMPFLLASLYIFILSLDVFFTQIFYAVEKLKYIGAKESISQILKITGAILLFLLIDKNHYLVGIFFLLSCISLITILFNLYILNKNFSSIFIKQEEKLDKKRINKFILYFAMSSIPAIILSQIDSITLGFFLDPEYVGYYKVALSLVVGVAGILSFTNLILLPVLSKANKKQIEIIFNKVLQFLSAVTIPAVFGMIVLGKYLIILLYGNAYSNSIFPICFLSPIIFFAVFLGIASSLFSAEEKLNIFAKITSFAAISSIILNLLLVKIFLNFSSLLATIGASLASILSWTIYLSLLIYYMKKEMSLKVKLTSLVKPLIASVLMFACLIILSNLFKEINILNIIVLIFSGIVSYLIFLILIKGINTNDIVLLKSAIIES